MAAVFLHHAEADADLASTVAAGLRREGFTEIYVPREHGSVPWEDALYVATAECRVIVDLVTRDWLHDDSGCFDEIDSAMSSGKRVVTLIFADAAEASGELARERLAQLRTETCAIQVDGGLGEGSRFDLSHHPVVRAALLDALRGAGANGDVGLDPGIFAVDPQRYPVPFKGLAPFGDADADAAVFFGRSREMTEVLEMLRAFRATKRSPPVVIVGPTGSGKTSLVQAGLLPRLRREAPAWLVMRPVRLDEDPLFAFADALSGTLVDFGEVADPRRLADDLLSLWSTGRDADGDLTETGRNRLVHRIQAEVERLRRVSGRPRATLVIAVDDVDALAKADDRARAVSAYLGAAGHAGTGTQLLICARPAQLEALRRNPGFEDIPFEPRQLRPLPAFRFDDVVTGPAERYRVGVDEGLTDALMADARGQDDLPSLALALHQLWTLAQPRHALTVEDYVKRGGLSGLIETVAEDALRGNEASVSPSRDADAARTFVPALVEVTDDGRLTCHEAQWTDLTPEGRGLLERFIEAGLVRRDVDAGTVAVCHASVFRPWPRLQRWLAPDRARFAAHQAIKDAAAAWHRGGRPEAGLIHSGPKIADARAALGEEGLHFEQDYLRACEAAEGRRRASGIRRRSAMGVAVAAILGVAVFGWTQSR